MSPPLAAAGAVFEREFPANPWSEHPLEPDKARLELAVHRTAESAWWAAEREAGAGWERCRNEGGALTRWDRLPGPETVLKSGRIRYEARCRGCGVVLPRSYHPSPIVDPGVTESDYNMPNTDRKDNGW